MLSDVHLPPARNRLEVVGIDERIFASNASGRRNSEPSLPHPGNTITRSWRIEGLSSNRDRDQSRERAELRALSQSEAWVPAQGYDLSYGLLPFFHRPCRSWHGRYDQDSMSAFPRGIPQLQEHWGATCADSGWTRAGPKTIWLLPWRSSRQR